MSPAQSTTKQAPDSGLVARMAEGASLSALYKRYFRSVFALARSILRSTQEAAVVLAYACLPALPDAAGVCGDESERCCGEAAPVCSDGLRCDAASSRCVVSQPRYCVSDEQCAVGHSCCISGLIGSCVDGPLTSAAGGLVCPQADLQVEVSREALGLSLERRYFDPEFSAQDGCALEKQCVGAPGERLLLHFSAAVRNAGDADLLFGSSRAASHAPGCDGQPYFANYLTYSLVDALGEERASGHQQARCEAGGTFADRFDCQFNGLARGAAQVYRARPLYIAEDVARRAGELDYATGAPLPAPDNSCQWIDVTDVEAGDYLLRIQVNADGVLTEARLDNNRVDVPVSLPRRGDPTQACPSDDEAWLLGYAEARECGWVALGSASCEPALPVTVNCAACGGAPLLRVCEGSPSCLPLDVQETFYVESDEFGSCPLARFACPPSGRYTVYQAPSGRSEAPPTCVLRTTP